VPKNVVASMRYFSETCWKQKEGKRMKKAEERFRTRNSSASSAARVEMRSTSWLMRGSLT